MKIAVCDDESLYLKQILHIANDYIEQHKDKEIAFELFTEPETLLKVSREKNNFDIYILDIVMPGMNGIQLGQALRNEGIRSKIIYLTSCPEYALEAFRVRAFDYILKPIQKHSFFQMMDEVIGSIQPRKNKGIIVKTRSGNTNVLYNDILYVELCNRSLIYHLTDNRTIKSTTLRGSFSDAAGHLLQDARFAQCGVSTIVNLDHITSVEQEGVLFTDSNRLFLSKKTCRELRGLWNTYWISKED